jgi:hypothetical protein
MQAIANRRTGEEDGTMLSILAYFAILAGMFLVVKLNPPGKIDLTRVM